MSVTREKMSSLIESKQIEWDRYKCPLVCFSEGFSFPVPKTVQRSTTADFVRTKRPSNDDEQSEYFSQLRKNSRKALLEWRDARHALETFRNAPNINPDIYRTLETKSLEYKNQLLFMAKNGIWNCGEFADFALIIIDELELQGKFNQSMYIANAVSLSNPQIPEAHQSENHDHAFVLITDKQGNPKFIIDLWQGLVKGEPFFGDVNKYIRILNAYPDGYYVRLGVEGKHIRAVSERYTKMASGEPDEFSSHHKAPEIERKNQGTSGFLPSYQAQQQEARPAHQQQPDLPQRERQKGVRLSKAQNNEESGCSCQ